MADLSPAVPPARALTIAGSDSGGGAGVQADLKTFLACGVHGMSAITAVTVQNSLGVSAFHEIPAYVVADQVESVLADIGAGAMKTGMLASAEIIAAVVEVLGRLGTGPLVVDPVCASQHGDPLLRPDALEALITLLLPLADVVTPNLGEVELLTGVAVVDRASQEDAARALHAMRCRRVLVKGGHAAGQQATDLLFDGETVRELTSERLEVRHTHGTGDTLAAATTAALAKGADLDTALDAGKRFVTEAIRDSFPLGAGMGPVGHFWRIAPC